jgi:transcriptional regulator with XRE-family HTH domain
MANVHKKLKGKRSKWADDADFRLRNRKWLRYSSNIARRVLSAIEDSRNLNQTSLAEKIGVSNQYISKVLKGHQNLTLETIGKLSDAIGYELISFPPYKYNLPTYQLIAGEMQGRYNIVVPGMASTSYFFQGSVLGDFSRSFASNEPVIINEGMNKMLRLAGSPGLLTSLSTLPTIERESLDANIKGGFDFGTNTSPSIS